MSNFYATDAQGDEFPSKAALKRFAAEHPDDIRLEDTSGFNNRGVLWGIGNLKAGDVIVGPNPWNKRNFYANIKNGKVV